MKYKESVSTVATLGNAAELVTAIMLEVVGNDIADTINGSPLTRGMLFDMSQSVFQAQVTPNLGA